MLFMGSRGTDFYSLFERNAALPGLPRHLSSSGQIGWGGRVLLAVAPSAGGSVARLAGSTPRARSLPKRVPESWLPGARSPN